jgi:nucleoside-diphosphate-sugar epimerase
MKDRRVLITGVAGRVGAAIALELARDNEVHGIDIADGVPRRNLEDAGVHYHKMYLGHDSLDKLPERIDYVFHQAVTWAVRNAAEERDAYMVSVKGVVDMLRKYHKHCRRFVLGSTGGVCAPNEHRVREDELRRPDATPYHSYKFAMEITGEVWADTEGADVMTVRYYWPWSEHNGFPHTWIIVPQLLGRPVSICMEKPNRFSPIFMPDCVRYSIGLAELPTVPRLVNVGGPEIASVEDMARISAELLGVDPEFRDGRESMPTFVCDTSQVEQLLGPPKYNIRTSLEAAVQWHREHPDEHKKREVFDAPGNWSAPRRHAARDGETPPPRPRHGGSD